jgi:DNA processing protein
VALSRLVEPGTRSLHRAVARDGAVAVWEALREGREVEGCPPGLRAGAAERARGYDPQHDLQRLRAAGGRLVCPGDDEWPDARLSWEDQDLPDAPPLALYLRGPRRLAELSRLSVAVVGARAATAYGVQVAGELATGLAGRGVTVVSGGAYGIDAAAHRGALSGPGPTVAVLACGVDVVYPRGNAALLARVAAQGLLVSELPPGCSPSRTRFLVRNRLIAALSEGTVVVEAAARSGSLSTLARAHALRRRAMVVPGPVTSRMSSGTNEQLRATPAAVCVTRWEEVLDLVGSLGDDAVEPRRGPVDPRDELAEVARRVLDAVPVRRGAGEASIARTAGVATLVVQQVLPPLLVHGLVERTGDGWRLTALGAGRPARRGS